MPNVSFDVFFDKDFINITATRGITAPKAKPDWKVRTAPKLPPKQSPVDNSNSNNRTPRPPPREKLTSTRQSLNPKQQPLATQGKVTELSDTASQTSEQPRRKPPKLGPRKSATPKNPPTSS